MLLGVALATFLAAAGVPQINIPRAPGGEVEVPLMLGPYGKRYAFPEIRDWKTLRISLARTACYGSCPVYSVEIAGDGAVRYEGQFCVRVKGERMARLAPKDVRALFEAFRKADFFSLRYRYSENTVDAPGVELGLRYDQWSKHVADNSDTDELPADAAKLPSLIDTMTNVSQWVGTVPDDCRPG